MMRDNYWVVLVAPADALPKILGTDDAPSTIPAPSGGWGVPGYSADGTQICFGVPAEHVTRALMAAWPTVQSVDRKTAARVVAYADWQVTAKWDRQAATIEASR